MENGILQMRVLIMLFPNQQHCLNYLNENTFLKSNLDLIEINAIISNISMQIQELVASMKSDSSINFNESWKLITLFIGGNDLCNSCKNTVNNFILL